MRSSVFSTEQDASRTEALCVALDTGDNDGDWAPILVEHLQEIGWQVSGAVQEGGIRDVPCNPDLTVVFRSDPTTLIDPRSLITPQTLPPSRQFVISTLFHSHFLMTAQIRTGDDSPCVDCLLASVRSCLPYSLVTQSPSLRVAASLICEAVFSALMGDHSSHSNSNDVAGVRVIDLCRLLTLPILVKRTPGCARCWPLTLLLSHQEHPLAAWLEDCARNRSPQIGRDLDITTPIEHARQLLSESPTVDCRTPRTVPLPKWPLLYNMRHDQQPGRLTLYSVASLLFLSFGRWSDKPADFPDRVLPSAGNLGSPEAFLVVSDLPGIPNGVYSYCGLTHTLRELRSSGDALIAELLSAISQTTGLQQPDALLIVASRYGRLRSKYGAFGYRLAHFDSGVCSQQLRTVLTYFSVPFCELENWPTEVLTAMIDVNSLTTPIMTVFGIWQQSGWPARSINDLFQRRPVSADAVEYRGLGGLVDTPLTLVRQIQEASELEIAAMDNQPVHAPKSPPHTSLNEPANSLSENFVHMWDLLLCRHSTRTFSSSGVPRDIIYSLLRGSGAGEVDGCRRGVTSVIATHRLEPYGLRQWQNVSVLDETARSAFSELLKEQSLNGVFVHPFAAEAPLVMWICADVLGDALRYRRTLLHAGRVAYTTMMAALYHGIDAVIIAGFWPHRVRPLLQPYCGDLTPVLAVACGLPQYLEHREVLE